MNGHGDGFEDDVAALALGILPAGEASGVARHVASCAECRAAYGGYRTAANFVGYAADDAGRDVDDLSRARLRSRIMKIVRESDDRSTPSVNGAARPAAARRTDLSWLAYATAVAAVVLLVITTVQNNSLNNENRALSARATQASATLAAYGDRSLELDNRIAEMIAPGMRRIAVANGVIFTSGNHTMIALVGMPALPAGKTYQAWSRAVGKKAVTAGSTFAPDAGGVAIVEIPFGTKNIDAVAVSVEPAGGSTAPTTAPTLFQTLT